jgi:hypothetical protein
MLVRLINNKKSYVLFLHTHDMDKVLYVRKVLGIASRERCIRQGLLISCSSSDLHSFPT